MISKRLARIVFGSTFVITMMATATALAQEGAAEAATDWRVSFAKALTMSISAMSGAYAQAKIGSAAAGTLAERPEVATNMLILEALPEIIVLLGFVIAFMI